VPDHPNGPAGRAGGESRLGIHGVPHTTPGQRADRRTRRWLLKALQAAQTTSLSSRLCGLPLGEVRVEISDLFIAHVTGIGHCGSPWSCPICAPVIRERAAQLYNEMATAAEAAGWSMLFVVGTHRHHLGKGLADSFDMTSSACKLTLKGRWWDRFKCAHHYAGMVRTVEVDYGWVNGWHDHWQSLMFFRGQLHDDDVQALQSWWFGRWDAVCSARGFGPLVPDVGLKVERLRSEDRIGDYLAKPAGSWGIGRELTRGDTKRHGELFPAFDLLKPDTMHLWREYEDVTRGRKFRVPSPGLQAELLGAALPEESDEELAAAEGSGTTILWVQVGVDQWVRYVEMGLVGAFLSNLELVARVVAFMAVAAGHGVEAVPYTVAEVEQVSCPTLGMCDDEQWQQSVAHERRVHA
jgi:hypothetical protein